MAMKNTPVIRGAEYLASKRAIPVTIASSEYRK
jgi:hypothetical protein